MSQEYYYSFGEIMNIVIVNTQPIPCSGKGAASVNRILSYTKGLVKNGNIVKILSTAVGIDNFWHVYEGIDVKHIGIQSSNSFINQISYFYTAFQLICHLNKEKDKDVVIFVTSNYILLMLIQLYCRMTGTKVVNERSEFPFVIMSKSQIKRFLSPLYTNTAYRMLDGMIIMTKPLMNYYKTKIGRNCKLLEVPMTVDSDRFESVIDVNNSIDGDYIAYCGNMGGNKDGLKNLLQSFSVIEKRGYSFKLLLIGGTNCEAEYNDLICLNNDLGNKNVIFYGKADRDVMPTLLKGAKMLVLARPSSLQSTGGFPTKLGEYLSTGNPVVVTAVGDIPAYLINNKNAYVVQPDDINAFADAICYVWDHYDDAKEVGLQGQMLAKTIFNGEYQAKRIEQFLNELLMRKTS